MAGKLEIQLIPQCDPPQIRILEDDEMVLTGLDFNQICDLVRMLIRASFDVGSPGQICRI